MVGKSTASRPIIIAILIGAILIAIGLAIGLALGLREDDKDCEHSKTGSGSQSGNTKTDYKSETQTFKYATVVADSEVASNIGNDILARRRGNAVDAAVAAMFATGVMSIHSAGIGGGSFFIVYDKDKGWHSIDSREEAPGRATERMFVGEENKTKSTIGGLAIGVPGEVKGLYEVHKRFGQLPWKYVVMPTVKLCQDGVPLTKAVFKALGRLESEEDKTNFAPYFDENKNIKPEGSLIKLPKLAQTYQTIADDPLSFFNGSLAQDIIDDLKDAGSIITLEDLKNYELKWSQPTNLTLPGNLQVYSTPPPGSGPVLNYILNILSGYNFSPASIANDKASILTHHRVIEAMKFAYAKRTLLGDSDFVDVAENITKMASLDFGAETRAEIDDDKTHDTDYYHPSFSMNNDQGTAHLSVIDAEGNAVSITSTINTYFGSRVKGSKTGIVFNNEMDDFSTPGTLNYFGLPASEANFIAPGKRPMSSMCPAIVWDENAQKVRLVTGAAGGSKITTATALNIMDVLWFGMSLPESVDRKRLHHQLIPTYVMTEADFPKSIIEGLKAKGHEVAAMTGTSVVQAALVLEDGVIGSSDYRKGGKPAGY